MNLDNFPSHLDAALKVSGVAISPWENPQLLRRVELPPSEPIVRTRRKPSFLRPDLSGYKRARQNATADTFLAQCYAHGATLFDTARGGCLTCEASITRSGIPPVRIAEAIGADHYDGTCETHGAVLFHTGSEQCVLCSKTATGRPRQYGNPRADARRAGQKTYAAECQACEAATDHSVLHGKCLRCFNTQGVRRKGRAHI
jgi:hypothetical protein